MVNSFMTQLAVLKLSNFPSVRVTIKQQTIPKHKEFIEYLPWNCFQSCIPAETKETKKKMLSTMIKSGATMYEG